LNVKWRHCTVRCKLKQSSLFWSSSMLTEQIVLRSIPLVMQSLRSLMQCFPTNRSRSNAVSMSMSRTMLTPLP
jgi:hypothetical protein